MPYPTHPEVELIIEFSKDKKWVLCKRIATLFFTREEFEKALQSRSLHSYFSEDKNSIERKGE